MTVLLCLFLCFHALGALTLVNAPDMAPVGFEDDGGFRFGLPA